MSEPLLKIVANSIAENWHAQKSVDVHVVDCMHPAPSRISPLAPSLSPVPVESFKTLKGFFKL